MEQYLVGKKRLFRKSLINPFDFLVHYLYIKNLLDLFQIDHILEPNTLILQIKFKNESAVLYPLFDNLWKDKRYYSTELERAVFEFSGWRPYKIPEIKSIADKLVLKDKLTQHKILTPLYSMDPDTSLTNIIVKRRVGAFSRDIKGPFHRSSEHKLDLSKGEFFEKFTEGALVKIWFWCKRPMAVILRDMCYVCGDGKRTIAECIETIPQLLPRYPREKYINASLNYFNRNLSTTLKKGEFQLVDFRWTGSRAWFQTLPRTVLSEVEERQFALELAALGNTLWEFISQESEESLAYTVDAILTKDRQLSILEINPNPAVHPFTYKAMCDDMLANLVIKKSKAKKKWKAGIFGAVA